MTSAPNVTTEHKASRKNLGRDNFMAFFLDGFTRCNLSSGGILSRISLQGFGNWLQCYGEIQWGGSSADKTPALLNSSGLIARGQFGNIPAAAEGFYQENCGRQSPC